MRELDVLLEGYMDRRWETAGASEQAVFAALLELQDPLLADLLLGRAAAPDVETARVVDRILDAATYR
ncbi:hypothetical protein BH24PSE2_BH24PSE2_16490 [soil metagenome]